MEKKQGTRDLKNNFRRLFPKVALFVWVTCVGMVSYMSLIPQVELPIKFIGIDKVLHCLGYLWLAVIPFFGFERFRMALVGACSMFLLGIGLEFVQDFVPGRFFSVADMIANGIGVVLGVSFGLYFKPQRLIQVLGAKISRF